MKSYQRYAKLIMSQHMAKIQFIADGVLTSKSISLAMNALLDTYGELSKLHTAMLIEEPTENVDEQNV